MPGFRIAIVLVAVLLAGGGGFAIEREQLEPFFEKHCYDCHDDTTAKGDLNLLDASMDLRDAASRERWALVHDRILSGEMPPAKKPRPAVADVTEVTEWLAAKLTAAEIAEREAEGRVRLRRLNRVEYEHTLRDLLALPQLEIKEMLPPDASVHGFDNVGSALRVSYVQMARYLDASRQALSEAARLAPEVQPYDFRLPFHDIRRFQITYDLTTIGKESVLLRQPNTAQTPWRLETIEIPYPGTHTIRIRGRGVTYDQPEGVEALKGGEQGKGKLLPPQSDHVLSIYQGARILGSIDLTADCKEREITAWLHPKEQLRIYVPTLQDWNPAWKKGAYSGPAVALEWIEIEGPQEQEWPSASYRALFDELPIALWNESSATRPPAEVGVPKHPKRFPKLTFPDRRDRYEVVSQNPDKDARRLLARFMDRAFRNPAPSAEVDRYLALVREELGKRKPFHEALLTGYSAVLTSPDFLYFAEETGELKNAALANRLSYFLWRSMPDDLLRLAKFDDLNVIREQTDRLIGDVRFERFVEDFTGQWLDLREIRATQPDEELYPEFDDFLLESMLGETLAFFKKMVRENLPVRSLIEGDFVIANNALADLYDLPPLEGVALREVQLPKTSVRGGLLTQAAILKVTANGTSTSPVVRGAWTLERILGQPTPPPPPEVPAVEPDTRGATTIRQLLVKHRADPNCASCHREIDPPGFALESFDVLGGWRERYRSLGIGQSIAKKIDSRPVKYGLGLPVDSTGEFRGQAFSDIHGFRKALLSDERQLARNLAERLVVFSTGAGVSFADRAEIERLLDTTAADGFRVRDLIHAVTQSSLFRNK